MMSSTLCFFFYVNFDLGMRSPTEVRSLALILLWKLSRVHSPISRIIHFVLDINRLQSKEQSRATLIPSATDRETSLGIYSV
jgi:hypothetical protein